MGSRKGNFNFGEPMPKKHKARVGGRMAMLESKGRRSDIGITVEDVKVMARMFFVDHAEVHDICNKFEANEMDVRKIITGFNFHQEWASAVVDLITEGHACDRPIRKMICRNENVGRATSYKGRLSADKVVEVRQLHLDGHTLLRVAEISGCSQVAARSIIRNQTYNKPEFRPKGWGDE